MSSLKELRWYPSAAPLSRAARHLIAALLQRLSAILSRLAAGLTGESRALPADPRLEFHAESGAPEGALYVDGRFVGWLPGVRRL